MVIINKINRFADSTADSTVGTTTITTATTAVTIAIVTGDASYFGYCLLPY